MESSGQSVVTPNMYYLTEILDDISSGDLRVPNFQRPYVWKPTDAISLFDSIFKGYPIGSVLFWETTEKLNSFTQIGPFELDLDERANRNYVIDGHQRLSTLYSILKSKKSVEITEPHKWAMYFDLDKDQFYYSTPNTKVANYIAMDKIINTIDFLDECKRIRESSPSNAEYYITKAQKLTQAIVTYKITIMQIKRGNLSSAVEIFSRLNTRGMDMTPDQMLSALTYKEGVNSFKLADKIDEILSRLIEYDYSDIDRIFIYRSIVAASKRDIYNAKLEDLANDKKVEMPLIVEKCAESIIKAVKFLRDVVKVPSDKFLPYSLQLVFLSEFYYNQPEPNETQIDELIKWFWFTSYSGWFAGANSSKIRNGLDDIRDFASNHIDCILSPQEYKTSTLEIPEKFDFRHARIKAFVLFLNQLDPKPLTMGLENHQNSIIEHGAKALHNIVPNEMSSFANKMILGPVRSGFAKNELITNKMSFSDRVLKSHAITTEAISALEMGQYKLFLILREKKLLELEGKFISTLGLSYRVASIKIPKKSNQFELFGLEW